MTDKDAKSCGKYTSLYVTLNNFHICHMKYTQPTNSDMYSVHEEEKSLLNNIKLTLQQR